jgi:hypothetical protein
MTVTVHGQTYTVTTEEALLRLLLALATIAAYAERRSA